MRSASYLFVSSAANLLQLTPPVEFFNKISGIAPARLDLNEKLEKNFRPDHFLDVEASCRSNLLEHLAPFAEQDGLLPVAFAKNHGRNSRQPGTLLELFNQDGHRMRHLLVRLHEYVLPDQLRRHESHRLIRDLILGKVAR